MEPILIRPRLTEQVAEHITRLIAGGQWPAGMVLPSEGDLAQLFGVSRTVVRECVRVLSSRGMVDVRQGRGNLRPAARRLDRHRAAGSPDPGRPRRVNALAGSPHDPGGRGRGFGGAVELAALRQAMDRLEEAGADPDAFITADLAFHLGIAGATGNPALLRLLRPVVQPLRAHLQDASLIPESQRSANREHLDVLSCIVSGDAPGARSAMAAHLARVARELAAILKREQP